ncbi:MAG: nucleotidyltransferase family protein [Candidatus Omnitrophica bacterium]|nr:nucleotidyltransferase family protein [Candidatus Omnitrophota bacterium]
MLEDLDVVILCGGLGKRLRSIDADTPKVMVSFEERPFLDIVMERLAQQGLQRFVLCTGYKAQWIEEYYRKNERDFVVDFSREEEPLGTGGAIKNAQPIVESDPFFVLNGDCFCDVDFAGFLSFHEEKGGVASMVAAHLEDSKDYGSLTIGEDGRILTFEEKQDKGAASINAGRYCFNQDIFDKMPDKPNFSLEYDVFPTLIKGGLFGFRLEGDFFDIGTPERYQKAMEYFKNGK